MQPAPPTPAAHVMPPPLATRSVEPSTQIDVANARARAPGRAPRGARAARDRSSVLNGAVEGSNHGYILSSKSFDECTSSPFLPSAKPVAEALHELFLGFVRRVLLAREDHDVLALGDDGVGLLVGLDARR